MKKIAILSDTHGLVSDEVRDMLESCDCYIHAGDFDNLKTYQIFEYYPGFAVSGNNDFFADLPKTLRFEVEGVRFLVIHNHNYLYDDPKDVDVVVYGHTHVHEAVHRNGVLWLNPGSCTRPRWGDRKSMVIMEVSEGQYRFQRIKLTR